MWYIDRRLILSLAFALIVTLGYWIARQIFKGKLP